MPKVSVVVPIFGVEKYIERCAKSLFEQTLTDMEFIFVDDCTYDHSIDKLQHMIIQYPQRKSQVKILHNERNLGLPQSRKMGVLEATGDFIAHCDSDDWVDPGLYEMMYKSALQNNADITVCDFLVKRPNCIELRIGARTADIYNYTVELLFQERPVSMVNKLIRRQIYQNEIHYPVLNMAEDMATTLQLIPFCKRMSFVKGVYYHYDGTTVSITRQKSKNAVLTQALQACENIQYVIKVYAKNEDRKITNGLIHLKFMQRRLLMPIINHKDVYEIWKSTFPEINSAILFSPFVKVSCIERLKFFLTLVNVFPRIKDKTRKNIN